MKGNCILGIMIGHGASAALCIDGKIVCAGSLERLTRQKYDMLLPISKTDLMTFGWRGNPKTYVENIDLPFDLEKDYSDIDLNDVPEFQLLLDYVLSSAGITLKQVDCVVYSYRYNDNARKYFKEKNPAIEFIVPEHHFAHACQAFLPSPFNEAAIMILDGQGVPLARANNDQLSGCLAYGRDNAITVFKDLPVVGSLGGMYAQFTRFCGFKTNEDGKTMGLAPYGTPEYYEILKPKIEFNTKKYHNLRDLKQLLNNKFLPTEYLYTLGRYYNFLNKFPVRKSNEPITDVHKNLAFAAQKIVEDIMCYLADWLYEKTKSENLCIAGGVGLNCVANYKVLAHSKFKNIFIFSSAGDEGMAVGQALYAYNIIYGHKRKYISETDYLGKEYTSLDVGKAVNYYKDKGFKIEEFKDLDLLYDRMASEIAAGKITSWWQGKSEFGPRALGNRSIIADPRRKDMKDILNSRVKHRESFRPFTPSVLRERASEFFTLDIDSPFMLLAPYVLPGKAEIVPAITHVDNTARVQTVDKDLSPRYYNLIKAFERQTGVPMILNTSFNIAGEPIVETPEDAIKCFLSTDIDVLGIDHFFISKR